MLPSQKETNHIVSVIDLLRFGGVERFIGQERVPLLVPFPEMVICLVPPEGVQRGDWCCWENSVVPRVGFREELNFYAHQDLRLLGRAVELSLSQTLIPGLYERIVRLIGGRDAYYTYYQFFRDSPLHGT